MKKIGKAIAKKFKIWKTTTSKETVIQEPSISSSTDIEQQPTVVTAKTTTAKDENSKEMHEVCKYSVINKDTTRVIDKATETDTQLCKDISKDSEDFQPIFESSEKAQNSSIETTPQEPNASDSLSLTEIKPRFDSGAADEQEKPLPKATQQRQATLVGILLSILS